MEVTLTEQLVNEIGLDKLSEFEIAKDSFDWKKFVTIDLRHLSILQCRHLIRLCEQHSKIRGSKVVIKDIETWLKATGDAGAQVVRKLEHLESLLIEYLLPISGHRIFKKDDIDGGAWVCHLVTEVEYHPEEKTRDYRHPAFVSMTYIYEKYGVVRQEVQTFHDGEVVGKTVTAILANFGWYAENTALRTQYLKELEKYKGIISQVGKQFTAVGMGTNDIPDTRGNSWTTSKKTFHFIGGEERRNRVVIDIFKETDGDDERDHHYDQGRYFWGDRDRDYRKRKGEAPDPTDNEEIPDEYAHGGKFTRIRKGVSVEDIDENVKPLEVPIHTFAVIFDLQRHMRLGVHVNYLTEYVYDTKLADKLILPTDIKELITLLVEHKDGGFKDIVAGKGGGAIILLTGKAGVGKTLTAEVFAESEKKPLYSVQASQLGIDPEELEKNLMAVLARSARWNAVMLLDEADVYVHERGNDLQQNAIVGVFLRVLEYHASVLFLTTNRPELVDDAIASRCVARIDYKYPSVDDQRKIWRVLADASKIDISDEVIDAFVKKHGDLSGRDIKNLLKLSKLISSGKKERISVGIIEYAQNFKPTVAQEQAGQ